MNTIRRHLKLALAISAVSMSSIVHGAETLVPGKSGGASFSPTVVQGLTNSIDGFFGSSTPDLMTLNPTLSSLKGVDLSDPKTREALAPVFAAVQFQAQQFQALAAAAPDSPVNTVLANKFIALDMLTSFQLPETRPQVAELSHAYYDALPNGEKEQIRAKLLMLKMESMVQALGVTAEDAAIPFYSAVGPDSKNKDDKHTAMSGTSSRPPDSWKLQPSKKVEFNGQTFPAFVFLENENGSVLEKLIATAKVSIEFSEGGAIDPELRKALDQAEARGVVVRTNPKNKLAPGSSFIIFDGKMALTGSHNATNPNPDPAYQSYSLTTDPERVRQYQTAAAGGNKAGQATLTQVDVIAGDISRTQADGLVTAINSGGMWFGGIDGVIQRTAGSQFHKQAQAAMPLLDGQTVVARGASGNKAGFKNVVFVVDDLQKPLREVMLAGLQAADKAGFSSVSLPTIRMGVMLGAVEKSVDEAVSEMAIAIRTFQASKPAHVKKITFVVFNDSKTEALLKNALSTP